ncbi:flagellar motility protein MotE (MotC chaperone) [Pararhizobium capsulatum DSM 1112]|uniref:Flagellar motility protein MotE (MotC chaperone) n=1 Tax=Pararhizobium capsulatum DSM 1112 TaxID=1121113 RepID=A0ABU0BLN1_9HYPH|nr:MotE family protein [Pararhizobium capsulatum]MDQ0319156.1 flagellar motility protein MotE (MotC chaperone) [Pararhizobium capsulatum DSM 1112]
MIAHLFSTSAGRGRRFSILAAGCLMLAIPGAFAQEVAAPAAGVPANGDEIQQFCTNIADAARDQRYVLQKQNLEELQAKVDERIATLEKRRTEYQDWLKRRDDFLKEAELGLTDIYKNMKPDAAAGQLELINPAVAAAIVMRLPPRLSSLILSEMTSEKAAVLANIISSASNPNTSKEPS